MKKLEYNKISKQNIIIWSFAFLFLLAGFILSFFNIVNVITAEGISSSLLGIDLYFKNDFNFFILVGWIFLLLSIISMICSLFFKKIALLHTFLIIIAVFIFAFLPDIINAPLPDNPEVTRYLSTSYSPILISLIVVLGISFILNIAINLDYVKFSIREICELAMLIGIAVVLNFFPKIPLQWSGSINFQIVPLVIIALRFSPFKTFVSCGVVFGLITCFVDQYGLFSFPLEYLVAFGSVAIISPFRNFILKERTEKKTLYIWQIALLVGLISVQTLIRCMCASIDSVIFYYSYLDLSSASTAMSAAVLYNAPYVFLTGVATIGVVCALYYPLVKINKIFKQKH